MKNFKLIIKSEPSSPLISILRKNLKLPLSNIKKCLSDQTPIINQDIHHNQYSEFIYTVLTLFEDLNELNFSYQCVVDDVEEPLDYVLKRFNQWHEIGRQIENEPDDHVW